MPFPYDQMIPHLPRLLASDHLPTFRQKRHATVFFCFQVDMGVRCEPAAILQLFTACLQKRMKTIGRVEKYHVERLRRALQIVQRIGLHGQCSMGVQNLDIFAELGDGPRILIDHHRLRRTARQRLETQRAAAGEQIQAAAAGNDVAQPVEQCLAHPVGSGAQALDAGEGELSAAPLSTDDAQLAGFVRGFQGGSLVWYSVR